MYIYAQCIQSSMRNCPQFTSSDFKEDEGRWTSEDVNISLVTTAALHLLMSVFLLLKKPSQPFH